MTEDEFIDILDKIGDVILGAIEKRPHHEVIEILEATAFRLNGMLECLRETA